MSHNPYRQFLRDNAKQFETALGVHFPVSDGLPQELIRSLDPVSAYQVLAFKIIGLIPAILGCLLVSMVGTATLALSVAVITLTIASGAILHVVGRMEDVVGLWRWRGPSEAYSVSRLRFFGQQFYPARILYHH
ncbi:hypothetical protein [Sandaracinobacteroides hominis]|uniref:hypothetical protein n=1 Tax=Sandaracinobacteroides hominis TaxID=2780086 RepID=UPI0018F64ED3|nr:hypothetical protein [Sandaracinobacteroides hominis]